MLLRTPNLRKLWAARLLEVGVVTLLVVAITLSLGPIKAKRAGVVSAQARLERFPELVNQATTSAAELKRHEHDISRLRALIVPREAIDTFLNRLETEAALHRVQVLIPDIQEETKLDKNKKPIPQTGPYLEVRVTVKAAGDPTNLLAYLHTIEHLPYTLRLASWDVRAGDVFLPPGLVTSPPPDAPSPPSPPLSPALLEVQLLLTVQQSHE